MRLLVCGGRGYEHRPIMYGNLDKIHAETPITMLIHGACPYGGADILAEDWAKSREVPYFGIPAQFRQRGRQAGPERNQRALEWGKPDKVLAAPGGKGTADMVRRAKAANIEVLEINA